MVSEARALAWARVFPRGRGRMAVVAAQTGVAWVHWVGRTLPRGRLLSDVLVFEARSDPREAGETVCDRRATEG